jgi:hypothetical protein
MFEILDNQRTESKFDYSKFFLPIGWRKFSGDFFNRAQALAQQNELFTQPQEFIPSSG